MEKKNCFKVLCMIKVVRDGQFVTSSASLCHGFYIKKKTTNSWAIFLNLIQADKLFFSLNCIIYCVPYTWLIMSCFL